MAVQAAEIKSQSNVTSWVTSDAAFHPFIGGFKKAKGIDTRERHKKAYGCITQPKDMVGQIAAIEVLVGMDPV